MIKIINILRWFFSWVVYKEIGWFSCLKAIINAILEVNPYTSTVIFLGSTNLVSTSFGSKCNGKTQKLTTAL